MEILQNPFGERWLKAVNFQAFEKVSSEQVFRRHFEQTFNTPRHLYVIAGTDSGLLAQYVCAHYAGEGRAFLFVERQDVIDELKLPEKPCDHVRIMPWQAGGLRQLLEGYENYVNYNRITLVKSLAVLDRSPLYEQLWEEISSEFGIMLAALSTHFINKVFTDRQIFNAVDNHAPAIDLEGAFEGWPVVILGGGPTLDEAVEWVRQHQDRVLIATVARVCKRLADEGIEPDIVATVDPHEVSYDNAKHMLQFSERALYLHTNNSHSSLVAEWDGAHAYTEQLLPWPCRLNRDNITTTGPTVTNTLVAAMLFAGVREIYLAGVDFCYGPGGETHESGSLDAKAGSFVHSATQTVETWSGRRARTSDNFFRAWQSMQATVEHFSEKGVRFISLGYESAKLEGAEYLPPDEVRLAHTAEDKRRVLEGLKALFWPEKPQLKKHVEAVGRELRAMMKRLRLIESLAKEGLELADGLFDDLDALDRKTRRIVRIKKQLSKDRNQDVLALLHNYAIGAYADFMDPDQDEEGELSQEQIQQNLTHFFQAVSSTAEDLRHSLQKAHQHAQMRLLEHQGADKLPRLAAYWREQAQEGRVRLWAQWHEKALVDEQVRREVEALRAEFERKLSRPFDETALAQALAQQAETMTSLKNIIEESFEKKDALELRKALEALRQRQDIRARQLRVLGEGYLAELEQRWDEAVSRYLEVEFLDLRQRALSRVLDIALGQDLPELALETLKMLTALSDEYYLILGDFLAIQGDVPAAVNIYVHYLNLHQHDELAWGKLLALLERSGERAEAANLYRQMKQVMPESNLIEKYRHLEDSQA